MDETRSIQRAGNVLYIENHHLYSSNNIIPRTVLNSDSTGSKSDGGGGKDMESRVIALETHVSNINTNIVDIKTDIREIRLSISGTNSQLNGRLDSYFWVIIGIFLAIIISIWYLYVHMNNSSETLGNEIRLVEKNLHKEISEVDKKLILINNNLEKLTKDK